MEKVGALSNYLKMHRKRSGLSQREVAYLLGCAHGSKVSRYERGERIPTITTVLAYEIIFGAPVRELYAGKHERVAKDVRDRARRLSKEVDAKEFTASSKQKLNSLSDIINRRPFRESA